MYLLLVSRELRLNAINSFSEREGAEGCADLVFSLRGAFVETTEAWNQVPAKAI